MFLRFFDEGLAQASFVLACDRTREAVVVDPRRDAAIYAEAARQHGLTIVAAIETHVHADFVSGSRELAVAGAGVICGPGSGLRFPAEEAADGQQMALGDLRLTFLHTPGHTPEHISILARHPGEPTRLFTGDLLFVGGVGRPDLLGEEQSRRLAHQLFASLSRVKALGDEIEVHPGHGAGSLCGAGIGSAPLSTIGRERLQNPMLQFTDEARFVESVLADLPETPPYFARMKRVNQGGPEVLGLVNALPKVPSINPSAAAALMADGALLVDLRDAAAFAAGHPAEAINIGFGSKVGYWAGFVIDVDTPVLLLGAGAPEINEAAVQLLRVGIDRVEGAIAGGFDAWRAAGLPVEGLDQIDPAELDRQLASDAPPVMIDVRTKREWKDGHLPGTLHIPVGDIPAQLANIPQDTAVVVLCEGGYRSSLASSLLARERRHPVNLSGGMAAWRDRTTSDAR